MGWKLLCNSTKSLKPDELWEPKRVYFLLPYSLFETNVSPLYFAPTARKLASVAQKGTSKSKSCNHKLPASSDRVFSDKSNNIGVEMGNGEVFLGTKKCSKSRSWSSVLATIREKSFDSRSESELKESIQFKLMYSARGVLFVFFFFFFFFFLFCFVLS
ncbi:hypothetical protein MIMGU_mgv1a015431mg [Erythranthe guttata]|uniref:Uncharacterized protein n=1 Tax=Erythranthe guttata TaxID=4155 RepID=A0A022PR44_ERYGU|nr:hypothetical protein MIMGU_mgv1a015431mg [Erythranthe guttata]